METPALFTRMSITPRADNASSAIRRTSSASVRSAGTESAVPPFPPIAWATRAAPAPSRSTQTTAAPSSAKRCAVSRPMPEAAPVMRALLPANLIRDPPYGSLQMRWTTTAFRSNRSSNARGRRTPLYASNTRAAPLKFGRERYALSTRSILRLHLLQVRRHGAKPEILLGELEPDLDQGLVDRNPDIVPEPMLGRVVLGEVGPTRGRSRATA